MNGPTSFFSILLFHVKHTHVEIFPISLLINLDTMQMKLEAGKGGK